MKDRIKQLLEHLGISAAEFADKLGVQRSAVSHILSGRNNPGLDFLQKILLNYTEINPDWLLLGNGKISRESITLPKIIENEPADDVRKMPKDDSTKLKITNDVIPSGISGIRNSPEKIIELYSDGTFRVYTSRKD